MKLKQRFKRWLFLRTINKMVKDMGTKVILHREDVSIDVLQINMGKDFTHLRILHENYNKFMLRYICNEVYIKYHTKMG